MGSLTRLRRILTIHRVRIGKADNVQVKPGGFNNPEQFGQVVAQDVGTKIRC